MPGISCGLPATLQGCVFGVSGTPDKNPSDDWACVAPTQLPSYLFPLVWPSCAYQAKHLQGLMSILYDD
jgi:hypothetical protein